jgi:hypothetical protein
MMVCVVVMVVRVMVVVVVVVRRIPAPGIVPAVVVVVAAVVVSAVPDVVAVVPGIIPAVVPVSAVVGIVVVGVAAISPGAPPGVVPGIVPAAVIDGYIVGRTVELAEKFLVGNAFRQVDASGLRIRFEVGFRRLFDGGVGVVLRYGGFDDREAAARRGPIVDSVNTGGSRVTCRVVNSAGAHRQGQCREGQAVEQIASHFYLLC